MDIVDEGYYWIRMKGESKWRVAQAWVFAEDDISWYKCGFDVPDYSDEIEVGERIVHGVA